MSKFLLPKNQRFMNLPFKLLRSFASANSLNNLSPEPKIIDSQFVKFLTILLITHLT